MFRIRNFVSLSARTVEPTVQSSSTGVPSQQNSAPPGANPTSGNAFAPHRFDGDSEAAQERREAERRRQRRRTGDPVSRRASDGPAYPVATSTIIHQLSPEEEQAEQSRRLGWIKDDMPGGRRLFFKLVIAFTLTAVFGAVFATLGGVYFRKALDTNTLLLVFCILGIVCGFLMVVGSFILAKTLISTKWKNNQQPTYRSMAAPTARFVPTVAEDGEDREPTVEIQLTPPSYEEAASTPASQSVYIISSGNVNVNLPDTSPPSYSGPENKDLPEDAPPMYSVSDPYKEEGAGSRTPPSLSSPPAYAISVISVPAMPDQPVTAGPITARDVQQILSGQNVGRESDKDSPSHSRSSSQGQSLSNTPNSSISASFTRRTGSEIAVNVDVHNVDGDTIDGITNTSL